MSEEMDSVVLDKLRIALKTEMEGFGFYNEAASMITDEKGKNVFKHLASEELDHMKVIFGIVKSVEDGKGWIGYEDAVGVDYTKGGGLPIFPEENEMIDRLRTNETEVNAVQIALDSEEEAVRFYSEMLKEASSDAEKEVLAKLLEMEKGHFDLLRWEKDALMNMGWWADMIEFSVEKER